MSLFPDEKRYEIGKGLFGKNRQSAAEPATSAEPIPMPASTAAPMEPAPAPVTPEPAAPAPAPQPEPVPAPAPAPEPEPAPQPIPAPAPEPAPAPAPAPQPAPQPLSGNPAILAGIKEISAAVSDLSTQMSDLITITARAANSNETPAKPWEITDEMVEQYRAAGAGQLVCYDDDGKDHDVVFKFKISFPSGTKYLGIGDLLKENPKDLSIVVAGYVNKGKEFVPLPDEPSEYFKTLYLRGHSQPEEAPRFWR